MKTKIKIKEIHTIGNNNFEKVIFIIELLEGTILINDFFDNSNLSFKISGVGMENLAFDKKSISIMVNELSSKEHSLFKDKEFISI